jgi:hypothetical protein
MAKCNLLLSNIDIKIFILVQILFEPANDVFIARATMCTGGDCDTI